MHSFLSDSSQSDSFFFLCFWLATNSPACYCTSTLGGVVGYYKGRAVAFTGLAGAVTATGSALI